VTCLETVFAFHQATKHRFEQYAVAQAAWIGLRNREHLEEVQELFEAAFLWESQTLS
jgi:hypothetical protein